MQIMHDETCVWCAKPWTGAPCGNCGGGQPATQHELPQPEPEADQPEQRTPRRRAKAS